MRGADKIRTGLARRLRRNSTNAELRLWNCLRSRALGYKFARQAPIGPYVVDFICRENRLVVEVDGGQHADDHTDRARNEWLTGRGYQILRFWNNDVMGNMDGVLETIATALNTENPPHPPAFGGRPLPASGER